LLASAQDSITEFSAAEIQNGTALKTRYLDLYMTASKMIGDLLAKNNSMTRLACEFSVDPRFRAGNSTDVVVSSTVTHGERVKAATVRCLSNQSFAAGTEVDWIQCPIPVMHLGEQTVHVRLRVNESMDSVVKSDLTAALPLAGLEEYSFLSLNSLGIPVRPLPYLAHVQPRHIYNLAATKNISVEGENFVDAGAQLQCIFSGLPAPSIRHTVEAEYQSPNSLRCPFGLPAALLQAQTLQLSLTNDGGLTEA